MKTYRVVSITNNIPDYPESEADTNEFPHIVKYVDDEQDSFVIDAETGQFWPADEFFSMVDVKEFHVKEREK